MKQGSRTNRTQGPGRESQNGEPPVCHEIEEKEAWRPALLEWKIMNRISFEGGDQV
jgi:hypothetical protein